MIFSESNTAYSNMDNIQPSPYELGFSGALMHVYENECNYNALMKAAALSEMKYYQETGGDLFVQEAGAFSSFISKAKEFFKKVLQKIKEIVKRFFMKIAQYTMKDKDFVKKYQKDLLTRNLKDFEFDGYKFSGLTGTGVFNVDWKNVDPGKITYDMDADAINDFTEAARGKIVGKSSAMTQSEFQEELHDLLYGDKESFEPNIRQQLGYISSESDDEKAAKREQKNAEKAIENIIKDLEDEEKALSKLAVNKDTKDYTVGVGKQSDTFHDKSVKADSNYRGAYDKSWTGHNADDAANQVKSVNNKISIFRTYSGDITTAFSTYLRALVDRKKQAKAICVKAMGYKNESASYVDTDDIFAGVQIL